MGPSVILVLLNSGMSPYFLKKKKGGVEISSKKDQIGGGVKQWNGFDGLRRST